MNEEQSVSIDSLAGRPAAEFTRHRESMLLLDRLLEYSPEHAVCDWTPPQDHPIFMQEEGVPVYVAIECMAQCVAVHAGARSRLKGQGPPLGLLLGTRQFRATDSHLETGAQFRVMCRELMRDPQGLASFDCEISKGHLAVASCRLAVYEYLHGSETDEPVQPIN